MMDGEHQHNELTALDKALLDETVDPVDTPSSLLKSSELAALEKALLDESADPVDIPFSLLKAITGNFSEAQVIGSGGFGVVYKGLFPSGGIVAVKKLFEKFDILDKNFESEVACLVGVKHKNTVRFLGHCSEARHVMMPYEGKLVCAEERQRLLCFEYLPKGCLADYLSDASCRHQWTTCYGIIKGICEGVHYLHQQRIIHMDLKPQNVLLDDNMVPRIADFGLSRRLSESKSRAITKNMIGTKGYMAPEFLSNGEITFKTDIYCLGVIIMEILMGHKECSNVKEVLESWKNKFGTSKSQIELEQVKACAEIAIKCTNYDPGNRPATCFIISLFEKLCEVEISNWSLRRDIATSTEGQISFASKSANELKLMDDSAAPSQLQPPMQEVEQKVGKVNLERKGKAATVSVSTGVMSILSGKLTMLMGDENNKCKEVRKNASFLEKELTTINTDFQQLELIDEVAPAVKNWRDDVREITYDMENYIDEFIHQSGGDDDDEAGFIGEAVELRKRLCELHQIANEIVLEANARRESYKIVDCEPSSSSVADNTSLQAVHLEATSLVGIDGPMEEIANWLMVTQKKLKVLSLVGFGGLGKTTLAMQVLDKFRGQFNFVAVLSISLRPDMRVLLNQLQVKLGIKEFSHDRGFDDIIEELRKCLSKKRYLIVIDDLWDQSAWKIIRPAFPENENGSTIIVTTRIEDLASVACNNDRDCIYKMKPLNEYNSRMLLSNRVFGSGALFPEYEDNASEILKKCAGLPLAIVSIASLLATQVRSRKHWEKITKSLGAQSSANPSSKEMNNILYLSYTSLPLHLQACLLFLGMYSEGHTIGRDDLVRQWIAEGFVSTLHGPDLEDVGRSYFNELVNRNMIQPSDIEYGEVLSCTVQNMMLDLIRSECAEDNFVSVAYNSDDMARLLHGCKYKVRRLSLGSMPVGEATYGTSIATSLIQVRSFISFENPTPPLLWFKHLRVLIIARGKGIVDLTAISQLFLLRYLMVRVRGKIELPNELGELVYLETLDIVNCGLIKSIPSDIVHLPRLSYLVLPNFTDLPEGIGSMKQLRTLQGLDLKKSSLKCIMGLGELTNLRELSMRTYYDLGTPKVDALVYSIEKLRNLKCLRIFGHHYEHGHNQHLGSLSNPFQHVERLCVKSWLFCRVPKWMNGLHSLCFLELKVNETSTEEVHLLGELPSLVHLDLEADEIPDERAILGTGLFPVLELFYLRSWKDSTAYLAFEAGVMPNLRILHLSANHWGGTIPVGMEHLLHLEEIRVYGAEEDVESAFREASLLHPNRPSVFRDM